MGEAESTGRGPLPAMQCFLHIATLRISMTVEQRLPSKPQGQREEIPLARLHLIKMGLGAERARHALLVRLSADATPMENCMEVP